jgi:Family of unknown function (DUF5947)
VVDDGDRGGTAFANLKRFLARKPPSTGEACDLCGVPIVEPHPHVVALDTRRLLCCCRACYLLFTHQGAAGGKYRAVPERYQRLLDAQVSERQWDALQIPVGIAFFFVNSTLGRTVAFYPSPAGATESQLPLDTWSEIVDANPALSSLEPDVEALLVEKTADGYDGYLAPIDACYELVGVIRRHWKGFDGGQEARERIGAFFAGLRERCVHGAPRPSWPS